MILCDSEIWAALEHRQIKIDPEPSRDDYTTTAVDLHLGETDFKRWKKPGKGVSLIIDPSQSGFYRDAASFLEDVPRESDDSIIIHPNEFLLALTKERIELPEQSRVAARVEGKVRWHGLGWLFTSRPQQFTAASRAILLSKSRTTVTFPLNFAPECRFAS